MNVRIALAAAVATLAASPLASAGRDTTAPNVVYTIPAVLTDKKIELTETHLPRGATIRYTVINRGSRPYAFQIGKARTRPIPPHRRALLRVYWNQRGHFVFRTIYRGKPVGPHGSVSVV
jgi:integrase